MLQPGCCQTPFTGQTSTCTRLLRRVAGTWTVCSASPFVCRTSRTVLGSWLAACGRTALALGMRWRGRAAGREQRYLPHLPYLPYMPLHRCPFPTRTTALYRRFCSISGCLIHGMQPAYRNVFAFFSLPTRPPCVAYAFSIVRRCGDILAVPSDRCTRFAYAGLFACAE